MTPLLRILIGFGYIADGLAYLLTLGLVTTPTSFALRASKLLARYQYNKENKNGPVEKD